MAWQQGNGVLVIKMKKIALTAKLNIKISCVVLLLVFSIFISQWMTLLERKQECLEQLEAITVFLDRELSGEEFDHEELDQMEDEKNQNPENAQAQAEDVNEQLRPVLAKIMVPGSTIKYGIYSRQHGRILTIGPDADNSLLAAMDADLFADMFTATTARRGEQKHSVIWYGDPILYSVKPVRHEGKVVGDVFACANLNMLKAEIWGKTINTFLAIFIAITLVIILFQEVIIRLKKDLVLFAEKVVEGHAKDFASVLPELNPVLTYLTEQTEKLARLDRLNIIGEMAAGIAHEVRNPMTTVRGFMQLMAERKEFHASREHFILMINELDRANSIISEFLALAKDRTMDFRHVDLNEIISGVFPLLQADAFRSNCQVELKLGRIPAVLADENSIRQLILNLVRNAIEAMPQGGKVCVITAVRGGKVDLAICDEGIGISAEIMRKLGTPFLTTKDQGTGLGLAVCYRIVQRHEAAIKVESSPGNGATFTVEFSAAADGDQKATR